jgi:hypothetical protein
METSTIKCPQCGKEINVSEIIRLQLDSEYKKSYAEFKANTEKEYAVKRAELEKKELDFEEKRKQQNAIFKKHLAAAVSKKEVELKKQIEDENLNKFNLLNAELNKKSNELKDLNKTKIEFEQLKREKDELASKITLDKERELNEKLKVEKEKIEKLAQDKFNEELEKTKEKIETDFQFKIKEKDKIIEDQKRLTEEMKRKQEQGSIQLRGEVQELAIEEILRSAFPFDEITEVPKGISGADVIQKVRNRFGQEVGKIVFESKRTKAFGNEWVQKLKSDAVNVKADICILITEAMPDGIEKIGQKEGVWICSFNDFKGLVMVLRESLIKINEAFSSQINKGEKMQMLYDYLMSNEFLMQVEAIRDGFLELQRGYIQEKNAMERIWKQREKQLEKVMLNTNHFVGSIQGIAGNSIAIKQINEQDILEEINV